MFVQDGPRYGFMLGDSALHFHSFSLFQYMYSTCFHKQESKSSMALTVTFRLQTLENLMFLLPLKLQFSTGTWLQDSRSLMFFSHTHSYIAGFRMLSVSHIPLS